MNLHERLEANSVFDNENMLDTFIQTRNSKHEELEKKNDQGVYDLKLRREIETVNENIKIVKAYIYKIL